MQYLLRLFELELIERERRMIERRIKAARFPATKSLDSFDFRTIPSLNKILTIVLLVWSALDLLQSRVGRIAGAVAGSWLAAIGIMAAALSGVAA